MFLAAGVLPRPLLASSFEVGVDDWGLVSVRARNAEVREVARTLAARCGLKLTIDEASTVQARFLRVDASFARRPLAEAVQRVLGGLNHELVSGTDGKPAELRIVQRTVVPLIPVVDASKVAPLAPATPVPAAAPAPGAAPVAAPATPPSLPVPAAEREPFVVRGLELPGLATPEEMAALPAIKTEMAMILRARPAKRAVVAAVPAAPAAAPESAAEETKAPEAVTAPSTPSPPSSTGERSIADLLARRRRGR